MQVQALQVLRLLDEVDKQQQKFDMLRAAMVAAGAPAEKVWPEYKELFGDSTTVEMDDPQASDPNATYDYSEVEWKGSEAKEEYEALMARVADLQKGRINGSALVNRGM